MKKHVFLLLCLALCLILAACKSTGQPSEGDEAMYTQTEQEVSLINENSNLLSCVLLSKAPEDAVTAQLENIRPSGKDHYICFPYRDGQYITSINLVSEDAYVFGISVGSNVEDAAGIMEEEGYTLQDTAPQDTKIYTKYYVVLTFHYDESNTITSIGVSVNDPAYQDVTY